MGAYGGGMGPPDVELQNASLKGGGSRPWMFFLYTIFPIPLLFLILLSVPLPAAYRRGVRMGVVNVLDKVRSRSSPRSLLVRLCTDRLNSMYGIDSIN